MVAVNRYEIIDAKVWNAFYGKWWPLDPFTRLEYEHTADWAINTATATVPDDHPAASIFAKVEEGIPAPVTITLNGIEWTGQITTAYSFNEKGKSGWKLTLSSDDKHFHRMMARPPAQSAADDTETRLAGFLGPITEQLVSVASTRTGVPTYVVIEAEGDPVELQARTENSVADVLADATQGSNLLVETRMVLPGQDFPGGDTETSVTLYQGDMERRWANEQLANDVWPHADTHPRLTDKRAMSYPIVPPYSWNGAGNIDIGGTKMATEVEGIAWRPFQIKPVQDGSYFGSQDSYRARVMTRTELATHHQKFGVLPWFVTEWKPNNFNKLHDHQHLEAAAQAGLLRRADGVKVRPDYIPADVYTWVGSQAAYAWLDEEGWVIGLQEHIDAEIADRAPNGVQQRQIPGLMVHLYPERDRRGIVFSSVPGGGLSSWGITHNAPEGAMLISGVQMDALLLEYLQSGEASEQAVYGQRGLLSVDEVNAITGTVSGTVDSLAIDVDPQRTLAGTDVSFHKAGAKVNIAQAGLFFYREQYSNLSTGSANPVTEMVKQWKAAQGGTSATLTVGATENVVFGDDVHLPDGRVLDGWRPGDRVSFVDKTTRISELIVGYKVVAEADKPLSVTPLIGGRDNGVISQLGDRLRGAESAAKQAQLSAQRRIQESEFAQKTTEVATPIIGREIDTAVEEVNQGITTEMNRINGEMATNASTAGNALSRAESAINQIAATDARLAAETENILGKVTKAQNDASKGISDAKKANDALPALNGQISTAQTAASAANAAAKLANDSLADYKRVTDPKVVAALSDAAKGIADAKALADKLPNIEFRIGEAESGLGETTQQISDLTGTLSEATTEMLGKVGSLQELTKTHNLEITNVKARAEKGISDAADAQASVDNMRVGGRNLARRKGFAGISQYQKIENTGELFWTGEPIYFGEKITSGTPPSQIMPQITIRPGEVYTASVWYKGDQPRILFYAGQGVAVGGNPVVIEQSGEWSRIAVSTHPRTEAITSQVYFYLSSPAGNSAYFTSFKVERGTVATDWSPAPEDTEAGIAEAAALATTARGEATAKAEAARIAAEAYAKEKSEADKALAEEEAAKEALRVAKAEALIAQQLAASDAQTKATAAETAAKTYAAAQAKTAKEQAEATAAADATSKAEAARVAAEAEANRLDVVVKGIADQALADAAQAKSDAVSKAAAAQNAAQVYAKERAEALAAEAEAAAIAEALRVAKAEAAAAEAAAAADATAKANEAERLAKLHAEAKANAAREAAESTAALDAKTKADKARTDAETKAQQLADAAQTAAETTALTALGNLSVGGRNLLLKSNLNTTKPNAYLFERFNLSEPIAEGEEVTITVKGSLPEGRLFWRAYNSGGSVVLGSGLYPNENGVATGTFKWKVSNASNTQLYLYAGSSVANATDNPGDVRVEWVKLERGNRATDWSPAPGDVDASVAEALAEATTARNEATSKSEAARVAAETYAKEKSEADKAAAEEAAAEEAARVAKAEATAAKNAAASDATAKANEAERLAKLHAEAKATAAKEAAEATAALDATTKANTAKSDAEAEAKRLDAIVKAVADKAQADASKGISDAATAQARADKAVADAKAAADKLPALTSGVADAAAQAKAANDALPAIRTDISTAKTQADKGISDAANAQLVADEVRDRTQAMIQQGDNLIPNGFGELGSNKYFENFQYIADDSPNGAYGSFQIGGDVYRSGSSFGEAVSVDTSKTLTASLWVRKLNADQRIYFSIEPLDADGIMIGTTHYMEREGTRTQLAQPLRKGDTKVHLVDANAAAWTAAETANRNLAIWNYVDGKGKKWAPGEYTRNVRRVAWDIGGFSGNTITLNSPWAGAEAEAGDWVSRTSNGSTYLYPFQYLITHTEWGYYEGSVKNFPAATVAIRPRILLTPTVDAVRVAALSLTYTKSLINDVQGLNTSVAAAQATADQAKQDAINRAAAAQSAAEAYAKEKSEADKAAAELAAAAEALRVAKAEADAAKTAAASDATAKANEAERLAKLHAEAQAKAARESAEATAALDAKNKADKARTDAEAKAKTLADAAQAAAESTAKTALDNLQIGGRNLIGGSNDFSRYGTIYGSIRNEIAEGVSVSEWSAKDATRMKYTRGSSVVVFTPQINHLRGETVTFSYWLKNVGTTPIRVRYNGLSPYGAETYEPGFSGRVVHTGKLRSDYDWFQHQFYADDPEDPSIEFVLWRAKLEVGTKATDWTPAPEDIDAGIATAQSTADTAKSAADAAKQQADKGIGDAATAKVAADNARAQADKANDLLRVQDTRNTDELPQYYWVNYSRTTAIEFKYANSLGLTGGYGTLTTVVPWNDSSGGAIQQTFVVNDGGATYKRRSRGSRTDATWGAWVNELAELNSQISTLNSKAGELTTGLSKAATQEQYNELNTRLWGEQGSINTLQGEINANNSAFQTWQTEVNGRRDTWENGATLAINHLTNFATEQAKWNKASTEASQALANAQAAQKTLTDNQTKWSQGATLAINNLQTFATDQARWNTAAAELITEQGKVQAIQLELEQKRAVWQQGADLAIEHLQTFATDQTRWNNAARDLITTNTTALAAHQRILELAYPDAVSLVPMVPGGVNVGSSSAPVYEAMPAWLDSPSRFTAGGTSGMTDKRALRSYNYEQYVVQDKGTCTVNSREIGFSFWIYAHATGSHMVILVGDGKVVNNVFESVEVTSDYHKGSQGIYLFDSRRSDTLTVGWRKVEGRATLKEGVSRIKIHTIYFSHPAGGVATQYLADLQMWQHVPSQLEVNKALSDSIEALGKANAHQAMLNHEQTGINALNSRINTAQGDAIDALKRAVGLERLGQSLITLDYETGYPNWADGMTRVTSSLPNGFSEGWRVRATSTLATKELPGEYVTIMPNTRYKVEIWAKASKAGSAFQFVFLKPDGTYYIGGPNTGVVNDVGYMVVSPVTTDWVLYEGSITFTNIDHVKLGLMMHQASGGATDITVAGFRIYPDIPSQAKVDEAQNTAIKALQGFEENQIAWNTASAEAQQSIEMLIGADGDTEGSIIEQISDVSESVEEYAQSLTDDLQRVKNSQWDKFHFISPSNHALGSSWFSVNSHRLAPTVTAKGTWVGMFVLTAFGVDGGTLSDFRAVTSGSRSWRLPYINTSGGSAEQYDRITIDFKVNPGTAERTSQTLRDIDIPENTWREVHSYTMKGTGKVNGRFTVGWDATSFGDYYGIKIMAGTTELARLYKNGIGPRLPGFNGYRQQTVALGNRTVASGTKLSFQVYSTHDYDSGRRVRDSYFNVDYVY